MKRTIYAYNVFVIKGYGKNYHLPDDVLEDLNDGMSWLLEKQEINRKEDYTKDKKILYLDKMKYVEEKGILLLTFISAKYNSRRRVVDTETMKERGILKGKKDGDKEKIHIALQASDGDNITCLYEYNSNGIGFKRIIGYMQDRIQEYHKELDDKIKYRFESKNIVSLDFIKSLEKIQVIKAVTLTVDQEDIKVSESKSFAGKDDISTDIDIIVKPASSRRSILTNTVKDFYKMYNDKDKIVKRITVDGDNEESGHLVFNTEQMKEKIIVEVSEEIGTGEVNSQDMLSILNREIEKYKE